MIRIEKDPAAVLPRIAEISALADSVKDAFGFLPRSAYEQQANKGQLWLALELTSRNIVGYLLFGGTFPRLKVFQVYVSPDYARQAIGRRLVSELKQFATDQNYLYVSAKVATELPANRFWQKVGFSICDQVPTKGTKRAKNIYVCELPTASLFTMPNASPGDFRYKNIVQLRNLHFLLDLNVYFDVVKRRKYAVDALRVFRLAMTGRLNLAVSEEFLNELKRNSPDQGPDPLLELAETIPKWPDIPSSAKAPLMQELRSDIFPDRSPTGRTSIQDESDLTHLALSIHYGADGFITREGAILRKSEVLRKKHGLNVISPVELLDTDLIADNDSEDIAITIGDRPLVVSSFSESDRSNALQFLRRLDIDRTQAIHELSPHDQGAGRSCWAAKSNDEIIGLLSSSQTDIDVSIRSFLYVDEIAVGCDRVIDHFFQLLETSQIAQRLAYTDLSMSAKQHLTYETAFARGYRKIDMAPLSTTFRLGKWSYRGPLLRSHWKIFRQEFAERTKLQLPNMMPSFPELQNTGLFVQNLSTKVGFAMSLREFETLTSTFIVASDRPSTIIPIRYGYAHQLLGVTRSQRDLGFSQPEALLRAERAYFYRPPGSRKLRAGSIVLFYVSGHKGGNKAAVGIARATSIQRLSTSAAVTSLGRQGVLARDELAGISNSSDELMAVTFDNYFQFPNEVPFSTLRKIGCIGPANLVTSQAINANQLESVLLIAYGEK